MELTNYAVPILYAAGMACILLIYLPFSPMTIDLVNFSRDTQLQIYLNRRFLWAAGVGSLGAVAVAALLGMAGAIWLWTVIASGAVLTFMFWSGYVPYVMTPPENPKTLDVGAAGKLLGPNDTVLGLHYKGEARAYPRDFIARPHYFSDVVGGTPVTISYCILCNSGTAFKSEIGGRPMKLQSVTAYNNNIIYHDLESDNFIQQLDGCVIHGPDRGAKLEPLPVIITTWKEWTALHPDTKLLYAPPMTLRDRMVAGMLQMLIPINKLAKRTRPWHRIQGKLDPRLPAMSFVFGVEMNGKQCAYPVGALSRTGVCNDTLGGEPIVIFYDVTRNLGNVFSRKTEDQTLSFASARDNGSGIVARDEESGSLWDVQGHAQKGAHANKTLKAIPHYNKIFWFSWALFKPDTRVFEAK